MLHLYGIQVVRVEGNEFIVSEVGKDLSCKEVSREKTLRLYSDEAYEIEVIRKKAHLHVFLHTTGRKSKLATSGNRAASLLI